MTIINSIDFYADMVGASITATDTGFHIDCPEYTADVTEDEFVQMVSDTIREWCDIGAVRF